MLKNILIIILLTPGVLLAECELNDNEKTDAYNLYMEAQDLYSQDQFADAYAKLQESMQNFSNMSNELELSYTCIHYVPGPYSPIIKRETRYETEDFNRVELGKNIKKFLNPNPYVNVQFQPSKTVVSVYNAPQNARGTIQSQLSLENFRVSVNGQDAWFNSVASGELKDQVINTSASVDATIQTDEQFGFKLYQ